MDISVFGPGPDPEPRPERWGPWATVAWGAGAAIVLIVSQTLGAVAYLAWTSGLGGGAPVPTENLESNGAMLSAAFLFSTPLVLAYFYLAVRLARVPFGEYMALNWPRWFDVLIGIGA